jgi:hypothetical protein
MSSGRVDTAFHGWVKHFAGKADAKPWEVAGAQPFVASATRQAPERRACREQWYKHKVYPWATDVWPRPVPAPVAPKASTTHITSAHQALILGNRAEDLDELLMTGRPKLKQAQLRCGSVAEWLPLLEGARSTLVSFLRTITCGAHHSELLHLAFSKGFPPSVLVLLRRGAAADRRLKGGNTYLHIAAHRGDLAMCRALLPYSR